MDTRIGTKAAAELLGVDPSRVRQMILYDKILPAVKAGRDWFVLPADVELAKSRRGRGRPAKQFA